MLDKTKTNPVLGMKIHEYLRSQGIETPMISNFDQSEQKIEQITEYFKQIMTIMNLDLQDDSLMETPKRMGKMYVNELFWGLDYANFPKVTTVENKMKYDEMIVEKNIQSYSSCEHHFLPIDAKAHVAYIPNQLVLGLSKMNRIVEFFSRRPQIQERLTEQIYHAMSYILDTEDIAVYITGDHYCVKSRGINDTNSCTTTSKVGGEFRKSEAKQEFLNLINP